MRRPSGQRILYRVGLLLIVLAVAGGCRRTATVSGKVRYRDRPICYGSVIFVSSSKNAHCGVIEPDGSYRVEDVLPGSVRIAVISPDPAKGRFAGPRPKGPPSPGGAPAQAEAAASWFPLPAAYEKVETSGLTATLGPGRVTHDIDLK